MACFLVFPLPVLETERTLQDGRVLSPCRVRRVQACAWHMLSHSVGHAFGVQSPAQVPGPYPDRTYTTRATWSCLGAEHVVLLS